MGAAAFVVLVLALSALAVSAVTQSTRSAKADALAHVRATAAVAGVAINRELGAVGSLVESYAQRPGLAQAVLHPAAPESDDQIASQLSQLLGANRGIRAVFFSAPDGVLRNLVPSAPDVIGKNFSYRDWYVGLKRRGGPYISSAYQTSILGRPLVVAAAAYVPGPGGARNPLGILTALYALDEMRGLTDEVGRAQGVELTVLDQLGDVVADRGRTPSSVQHSTLTPDPEELAVTVAIADIGWTVRAQIPVSVALSPVRLLRTTVLSVVAVLLVVLGLVVLFAVWLIRRARVAELAASAARERAVDILEASNDGFVTVDRTGRIIEWNRQAARLLGWPREVAVGAPMTELLAPARLRDTWVATLVRHCAGDVGRFAGNPIELPLLHRDGREVPVEVFVWTSDRAPHATYSAFLRDVSERRRYEEQLRESARTDPLTAAGNRLRLSEDLSQLDARAHRYGHSYSLAVIDVDEFKSYNDTYGHLAGDEALRAVAAALDSVSRDGDGLYRYGGEEFVVVLPEQLLGGAVAAGERLRAAIEHLAVPHEASRHAIVTVSVGVATLVATDDDADMLLRRADVALYEAKRRGRNRVEAAMVPALGADRSASAWPNRQDGRTDVTRSSS